MKGLRGGKPRSKAGTAQEWSGSIKAKAIAREARSGSDTCFTTTTNEWRARSCVKV